MSIGSSLRNICVLFLAAWRGQ